ncbi:UVR8, partial [Symbiodinium necroappetens]
MRAAAELLGRRLVCPDRETSSSSGSQTGSEVPSPEVSCISVDSFPHDLGLPMRVPVVGMLIFSSDSGLMGLREDMLRRIADPEELDRFFIDGRSHSLVAVSEETLELFGLMADAWSNSARRRFASSRPVDGPSASDAWMLKANTSNFCSVRMLADIYSGWYSSECLGSASSLEDFQSLATRFSRCLMCCSANPHKVDSLIWAEMLQVLISFLAHAVSSGFREALSLLPFDFSMARAEASERDPVLQFAADLWREAMTTFRTLGCLHDAFAMTTTMILLSGTSVEVKEFANHYVDELVKISNAMPDEAHQPAFRVRAEQL